MIPLIQQALVMGYTATQVINFLSNKIPNMGGGLKNARKRGYSDEDILKFLSNKIPMKDPNGAKKYSNQLDDYLSSQGIKTKEERAEDKARAIKGAIGVAGTALGAYKAYQTYSGIGKQLLGFLGEASGVGPKPMGGAPIQPEETPQIQPQQPIQGAGQPPIEPQLPTQEQIDTMPELQPEFDFLKKRNLVPKIQTMIKAGKSKPEIIEFLKKKIPMMEQEYLRSFGPSGQMQPVSIDEKLGGILDRFFPEDKKANEISVGSQIITPDGDIGTIENLPGKTAKIDIEGDKKIHAAEDLTPVPENEDEILELYERLIQKIPETLRSAMLNWVGYDTDRNLLQVKFHNGDSYTYEEIPQEFAEKLKDSSFLAKTTGGNYYGNWEQGESSRGAGVAALIRELQKSYGGKGKEYTGKFREVYSFLGLPEEKLREKLRREREEKKKKKRKGNP